MTIKKTSEIGCGYTTEDSNTMDSSSLTDEELVHLKPDKDVLPTSLLKYVTVERRKRGRPPVEYPKQAITLRLDPNVIASFKKQGKDWRTRMGEVLKKASGC
ncbi:BrnA antitoxin family protein [Bartonella phoceensis]|uniref:BrnA antitoxin family protein n=1 Tax=Bartonella phoceensis TaxID=270249 RepID=UPI001ABB588F|nr:BrnA antitoxin family protein [Bartonella phoceensis]